MFHIVHMLQNYMEKLQVIKLLHFACGYLSFEMFQNDDAQLKANGEPTLGAFVR